MSLIKKLSVGEDVMGELERVRPLRHIRPPDLDARLVLLLADLLALAQRLADSGCVQRIRTAGDF